MFLFFSPSVTNLILLQDDLIYQQKMFSRKQLIFSYELKKFDSKLEVERKKSKSIGYICKPVLGGSYEMALTRQCAVTSSVSIW